MDIVQTLEQAVTAQKAILHALLQQLREHIHSIFQGKKAERSLMDSITIFNYISCRDEKQAILEIYLANFVCRC